MTVGLALLSLSPRSVLAAASPVSREAVVQDLAKRAWELLHRGDLDQRHRLDQLTQLLTSETDVPLISCLVLGRHWRQLTEAQRAGYEQLFDAVVMRNLARRLDQYANGAEGSARPALPDPGQRARGQGRRPGPDQCGDPAGR